MNTPKTRQDEHCCRTFSRSSFQVKLGILDYALHTLNQIQRKWVYLEPIFGMGALPAEQGRFRRVEEEFRDIMAKVGIIVHWLY